MMASASAKGAHGLIGLLLLLLLPTNDMLTFAKSAHAFTPIHQNHDHIRPF